MEARLFSLESKNIAANLIFRGLGMNADETKQDTKSIVGDILKSMGLDDNMIDDAYRFKKSEKSNPAHPPVVLVKLKSPAMKGLIFKSIQKLRDTDFKGIQIKNQYPAALSQEVFDAEKKAYEIREEGRKTGSPVKTRVEIVRGKVYIKKKGVNDVNFVFM